MKRWLSLSALCCTAFAATLMQASSAQAYDTPEPATICAAGKGENGKIDYFSTSVVNTNTSASAKVYCPIPYEAGTLSRDTTTDATVEVAYVDQSTMGDVKCTLHVDYFDGAPIISQSFTSTGVHDAQVRRFFWTISRSLFGGGRIYSVSCQIPQATSSTRSGLRFVLLHAN